MHDDVCKEYFRKSDAGSGCPFPIDQGVAEIRRITLLCAGTYQINARFYPERTYNLYNYVIVILVHAICANVKDGKVLVDGFSSNKPPPDRIQRRRLFPRTNRAILMKLHMS